MVSHGRRPCQRRRLVLFLAFSGLKQSKRRLAASPQADPERTSAFPRVCPKGAPSRSSMMRPEGTRQAQRRISGLPHPAAARHEERVVRPGCATSGTARVTRAAAVNSMWLALRLGRPPWRCRVSPTRGVGVCVERRVRHRGRRALRLRTVLVSPTVWFGLVLFGEAFTRFLKKDARRAADQGRMMQPLGQVDLRARAR